GKQGVDMRLDPLTVVLKRVVEFVRAIARAVLVLFGLLPQTTTEGMTVSTAGNLSPLGEDVLSLSCNETTRNLWISNRQQAIQQSGLSTADQNTLSTGTASSVASTIVQQSGGAGSRLWICIWIR